jgi:predicted ATP-binding protein involved in virulence
MRIDRLTIENFSGFVHREFYFHPHFNLLVGDNATGKTSVLDALAVLVGSWFLGMQGLEESMTIRSHAVRVAVHRHLDSYTFEKQFPVRLACEGLVMAKPMAWMRELRHDGGRTTTGDAKPVIDAARDAERRVRAGEGLTLPIICSYGTERLWYESKRRQRKEGSNSQRHLPSRLDGYLDCFNFMIQETALVNWIRDQGAVAPRLARETIALTTVKGCIKRCIEGARSIDYDGRYKDLVVSFEQDELQLFGNLSDGQRIMLLLVSDLARRAVTLNPHLEERAPQSTPGIVLIDELDLHLHPRWQRRVIHDLRETFPAIQFITTTHSPQLIGEASPEEILVLADGQTTTPPRSFGVDSSRLLEEVMGASPRNAGVADLLSRLAQEIDREDSDAAELLITQLEGKLGPDDPEVTRARALMTFMNSTG